MTSPNAYHCLKQVVRPIRGHFRHIPELTPTQTAPAVWSWRCPKHLPMIWPQGAYPLLCSHGLGQTCTPHLLIILTKPNCHHNDFWGSRCDSNQAHTISLKPCVISRRFRHTSFNTQHISSHRFLSSRLIVRHSQFPGDSGYISSKFNTFRPIPAKTNFPRLPVKKILQNVQIISITQIYGGV